MMKLLHIVPVYLCVAVLALSPQRDKGWHGIIPLHSTRIDVERMVGAPERSSDVFIYRTTDGLVQVEYATSPCKGSLLGWNVPSDTVLQLHLVPNKVEHFTFDESKYVKAYGHSARTNYINLEEGVKYEVLPDGSIYSISYSPSKADSHFRCSGFPPYDGGVTQYRPFDTYVDVPFADEEARLDNFASALQDDPASNAYIIVYAGRRARVNEAKISAERAREYLIAKRSINKQRLIALDGGYREKLETELYLVPTDMPPPTPTPTIPSNEAQITNAANTGVITAVHHRRPSRSRCKQR